MNIILHVFEQNIKTQLTTDQFYQIIIDQYSRIIIS